MTILISILTGVITAGLLAGAFYLGYMQGKKAPVDNSIEYNDQTKSQVQALADWLMYNGGRK